MHAQRYHPSSVRDLPFRRPRTCVTATAAVLRCGGFAVGNPVFPETLWRRVQAHACRLQALIEALPRVGPEKKAPEIEPLNSFELPRRAALRRASCFRRSPGRSSPITGDEVVMPQSFSPCGIEEYGPAVGRCHPCCQ
jgi:hypothetical protein